MIALGENIKQLRLRDGRTQDALAGELGVTAQAVSRWEKGICCPDMELIPSIANYFGVSIDTLFGYDNDREKRVNALAEMINAMNLQNNGRDENITECIALAREALAEFPGNEKLTLALASALFNAGYVRRGEHHTEDAEGWGVYDTERHRKYPEWREAIKLYEKLLLSLNAGELRQKATAELSQLYKNTGEHEKALALAELAPELSCSRPFLRINAFDGRAAVTAAGEALLNTIVKSAELMVQIVLADRALPPETGAEILRNAEGLFECIIPDGGYGRHFGLLACIRMLSSYYLWLADKRDEAFCALDTAAEYAKKLDSLRGSGADLFASPLLRSVSIHAEKLTDDGVPSELPDLWPWWDVPEYDRVKSEMQADPRWDRWAAALKE